MILITEYIEAEALAWLRQRVECYYGPNLYKRPQAIHTYLAQATGLIVRNRTKVTEELLQGAKKLRVVGRLGAGLDNLDREALARRHIRAVYAPGYNANAVAELCLLYMLAFNRRLQQADEETRAGVWRREALAGKELRGQVVGIVGLGAIGERLATICQALDCQVITTDRGPYRGVQQLPLAELLAAADFVSIHIPLTPATKNYLGAAELALMKPTAVLINTARGGVVDEDALYEALRTKRIAGAALDVRQQEPSSPNDRFHALDNVILTPHLGGWTIEAQQATSQAVVADVWRVLQGENPLHPVPTSTI